MKKFTRRLQYGGMRFVRKFRRGEKGFTLMELLIVIGILGVLAAVLVPRLSTFFSSGQLAAANQEVAGIETAALAYYADNNGVWPDDTDDLGDGSADGDYLSAAPIHATPYPIGQDSDGKVSLADGTASEVDDALEWSAADHRWIKAAGGG